MKKIEEIIQTYRTLEFYKDKGCQVSKITGKVDGTEMESSITFETKFDRKGSFSLKYSNSNKMQPNGLIIKEIDRSKAKSIVEFGINSMEEEMALNEALATHAGVSKHLSYTIPSLLYGKYAAEDLFYEDTEKEEFECSINGEKCIGLKILKTNEVKISEEDVQQMKDAIKNYPTLKKEMDKLEPVEDQTITKSLYYFRLKDNLLIKVERYIDAEGFNSESFTYYEPQLHRL